MSTCEYCDRPIMRDSRGKCRNCGAQAPPRGDTEPGKVEPGGIYSISPGSVFTYTNPQDFERLFGRALTFVPRPTK